MIMIYLLRNYEFKLPDGQTGRPSSLIAEAQCLPNHEAKVMLRGRLAC